MGLKTIGRGLESRFCKKRTRRLSATVADLAGQLQSALGQVTQLQQQLDWFKRQLFGRTSEKRLEFDEVEQANLFAALGIESPPDQEVPTQEISYRRREKRRDGAVNECGLRFDETVPVETIQVADPVIEAIPEAEREVVGEKVSHRLAQEPGSYKILKYVRQVVKRRDTGELLTPPAPAKRSGAHGRGRQFPGPDAHRQVPISPAAEPASINVLPTAASG